MKKCSTCGCENLAVTVQYRKTIFFRILKFLCLIAIFATIILNIKEIMQYDEFTYNANLVVTTQIQISDKVTPDKIPDGQATIDSTGIILLGLTIALIFCEIMKQWIESKKCIYYVCKGCDKIWCICENIE